MSLRRYMEAWIRLHASQKPAEWTDQEITETFLLLPLPSRTLPEWLALTGGKVDPSPSDVEEMSQEEVWQHNARAEKNILRDPMLAEITKVA